MKTMLIALLLAAPLAHADPFAEPQPANQISLEKMPGTSDRFFLMACREQICEPVGNKGGYTAEQIERLAGHSREVLGVIEGTAEAVVIPYVATSATIIGATGGFVGDGYAAALGLASGAAVGGSMITTVKVVKALNPVHQYRQGAAAVKLKVAAKRLEDPQHTSEVLYRGASRSAASAAERRFEEELDDAGQKPDASTAATAQ